MKNLYIIGNGFDIFTGLHTRYIDFRQWLYHNYPFIYENMKDTYDTNDEWWNDFEDQLGKLNVRKFVQKYTPRPKSLDHIRIYKEYAKQNNLSPNLYPSHPCAERLRGLLDILQYCFEKWVADCQKSITNPKLINLDNHDSFFINFNYTDTLQMVYNISDEKILYIHGQASKKDHLIFGHNSYLHGGILCSSDEAKTYEVLSQYYKNPYQNIFKYEELPQILSNVSHIHVYGFSFSPIDTDYLDWIVSKTASNCQWEISWYTKTDKKRINKFILDHYHICERFNLIQLEQIN